MEDLHIDQEVAIADNKFQHDRAIDWIKTKTSFRIKALGVLNIYIYIYWL